MEKNVISYLITTETSLKDETNKRPSFINVFSYLFKQTNESLTYSFCVVGKLCNVEPGETKLTVTISHETERSITFPANLTGDLHEGDLEITAYFPLITFEKAGKYYIRLKWNGIDLKDEGKFYFEVKEI